MNGHGDLVHFFEIHQRPWDFDYFTSMYRSPIVSDANMQNILSQSVNTSLANIYPSDPKTNYQNKVDSSGYGSSNISTQAFSSGNTALTAQNLNVNTANIRQLFANEKLAMITGRTRKNYDSQVLAHHDVS